MPREKASAVHRIVTKMLGYLTGNYTFLLSALLLQFVVYPIIADYVYTIRFMDLLFSLIMAAGIYDVNRKRKLFRFALFLLITVILLNSIAILTGMTILVPIVFGLYILFFCSIGLAILSDVLEAGNVTSKKIRGAVCVYLLLGYMWGTLYCLIELLSPGSFIYQGARMAAPLAERSLHALNATFFYYSFVTLSTTGYGDITPVTIATRSFSILEAITGQLYLAILIGRLVGLHIMHHPGSRER